MNYVKANQINIMLCILFVIKDFQKHDLKITHLNHHTKYKIDLGK